jgi:tripartite-type tricarboxylate transporter receptor subunit TctC
MQVRAWLFAACMAAASSLAQAQDYPSKPVTFITPAAAGNSLLTW